MPVNPQVLQELIKKYGKKAVGAAMNAAKAKVMVPNMTGTATAASTSLGSIPKVESTVGKEAAVAAMSAMAPVAGPVISSGIVSGAQAIAPTVADLAAFEATDRLPQVLYGGDRLTEQGAKILENAYRAIVPDGEFEEKSAPYVHGAGTALAAFPTGVASSVLKQAGVPIVQGAVSEVRDHIIPSIKDYYRDYVPNRRFMDWYTDRIDERQYLRRLGNNRRMNVDLNTGEKLQNDILSPGALPDLLERYHPEAVDEAIRRATARMNKRIMDVTYFYVPQSEDVLSKLRNGEISIKGGAVQRSRFGHIAQKRPDISVDDFSVIKNDLLGFRREPWIHAQVDKIPISTDLSHLVKSMRGAQSARDFVYDTMKAARDNGTARTIPMVDDFLAGKIPMFQGADKFPKKPSIEFSSKPLSSSLHRTSPGTAERDLFIGIGDALVPTNSVNYPEGMLNLFEVVGHETAHANPVYNTRITTSHPIMLLSGKPTKPADSPYYWNDYSWIPQAEKNRLSPKTTKFLNDHDVEVSENYSDLFGVKAAMNHYGVNDGRQLYTEQNVEELTRMLGPLRYVRYHGPQTLLEKETAPYKAVAQDLNNIRKDGGLLRNYFEGGGPEDGSVEKYISDRISEMRTAALENSRTRTDPAVPIVREYIDPKNSASLYNFCSQGYYSDADRNTTGLALYGKDGTVINTKVGVRQTKRAEEDYEKAIKKAKDFQDMANELYAASPYYIDVPGATCIYTATDNYGPSHRVSGNQTFAASPEKYGFVQIPMEGVQPGDIIQHVEYRDGSRVPVHGMIYDGQDSEGNMLFNYSDGGTGSSAIKVGSRYFPYDVDPNRHGNAFRFVGTPADSLKWKQEYMNLNAHSGGGKIRGKRSGKFYVTELNDRREKKFQDWYANAAATLGLDPNPDAYEQAYDYRGYWLNNRDADVSSPGFHFPDTWKQPHHPTFSDESIYAKGHEGVGHWDGDTFVPGPFNRLMQATEPTASAASVAPISYGNNYVPSEDILNYIKDTEDFRDQWYQDGNGVWTIGYGFTGDDVRKRYPNGMTRAEADQYFADSVKTRIPMFVGATPNFDRLNQNQRDALFSYYYNIGHGGHTRKSPAMQEALKNFDLDTVVNNIDFGYNDKKNRGLRKRRDYERKLFGTPMDYGGILNRLRNVYGDNESVKAAILRAKNVKK